MQKTLIDLRWANVNGFLQSVSEKKKGFDIQIFIVRAVKGRMSSTLHIEDLKPNY